MDRDIEGETCVHQATVNENPHTRQDEVHVVISGGHGYNEFNSENFIELLFTFNRNAKITT
ncbi:protein of unknown function [Paenibacillus alvei]|uniref:Uncharacterized protein n=1 Tax=Paenibacillus alvei TaxID=44250 RepID=A0A383R851_PAEAL|nr:protein of unknown function [Paenibacillus alvei]